MTPLVHGRRTLRRLPRGGVLGRRFSVWDAMGYHGIAWASNRGPLTVPTLKEWLRGGLTGRRPPLVAPRHWSPGAKQPGGQSRRRTDHPPSIADARPRPRGPHARMTTTREVSRVVRVMNP